MVKIKRKVSLIVSIGVLLTNVSPIQVLADKAFVTVSKNISSKPIDKFEIDVNKYIPKIKSIFQIGDEYGEFETYRHGSDKVTSVSWNKDDGHISVHIDESGNIVG